MTDYVLSVVDELTKPVKYKHLIERRNKDTGKLVIEAGHPVIDVVKVELPTLLQQLETAVTSSIGGTTRGASLPSERIILDADALFRAVKIRNLINDWCRRANVRPGRDTTRDLRAWYAATLATGLTDEQEHFHVGLMKEWVGFIRGKLDPTRELDLPFACPVCGAHTWWQSGQEYRRPLVVRYQPEGPDMVSRARGLCRACDRVFGVRELAYALEHGETINDEEETA